MSEAQIKPAEPIIACDLNVFTPEQLARHLTVCDTLFAAVREVRDLPDGYAFRLPEQSATLDLLTEFIAAERRCCSFESFSIQVEPYGGAIWLHLIEPEGVKEGVLSEVLKRLDPAVAAAAGLSE